MAFLDQPININDLPEDTGGDFSPVPAGEYHVSIKDAELKPTNDGTGQYIKLRLDIIGPTHAGRVIFANINIRNKSQQAESIGRAQLGAVMKALGMASLQDTDQLISATLMVKVAIREARTDPVSGKTYEASNDVKSYKPIDGAMPISASASAGKSVPAASAVAKSSPPWARK